MKPMVIDGRRWSKRRMSPHPYEPGVWFGPTWCWPDLYRVDEWWSQPRMCVHGRWLSGRRVMHMLYLGRRVNPVKKNPAALRRALQWRMAKRCGATRWTTCPF